MKYDTVLNESSPILSFQPFSQIQTTLTDSLDYKQSLSIYVHIPYCRMRCFFCSINTCQVFSDGDLEKYVQAVIREIHSYNHIFNSSIVRCIHFGGGTPSVMTEQQLDCIFNAFRKCIEDYNDIEIVFEAHPLSLTVPKLELLSSYGNVSVNLGVQTFDTQILHKINRGYDYQSIHDFLDHVTKMNFRGLGIDLICNLPGSNLNTTIQDINTAHRLGIKHLALYPLRVEHNCIFFEQYKKYEADFLEKSEQAYILGEGHHRLNVLGYNHYSIYHFEIGDSNNYIYARDQILGKNWIGLGAGAFGFYNNRTLVNDDNLDSYIQKSIEGISSIKQCETLNTIETIKREFAYSLRSRLLTKAYYTKKYGCAIFEFFDSIWADLIRQGYASDLGDSYNLTVAGILDLAKIQERIRNDYH